MRTFCGNILGKSHPLPMRNGPFLGDAHRLETLCPTLCPTVSNRDQSTGKAFLHGLLSEKDREAAPLVWVSFGFDFLAVGCWSPPFLRFLLGVFCMFFADGCGSTPPPPPPTFLRLFWVRMRHAIPRACPEGGRTSSPSVGQLPNGLEGDCGVPACGSRDPLYFTAVDDWFVCSM